ncbi:hypothetical protein H8B02_10510 [Bradyrhizobium sp. Pear77]|uniref:hypothetical protein n=1 Tax=Bradyrhizobium TaxID=374 RepID=UPI001E61F3F2|nr:MULTISPECIES: hypothetical protein [Bradyrhizobium]MCC8953871.1 hypothetical protein [Bradyrhizobium altum]MCC8963014.1 hypothetical protein [Bradyrhizobium oropedii]
MRITNARAGGHVDADVHTNRGGKEGAQGNHRESPGARTPIDSAANPAGNSQDAALRQAFNVALGTIAAQMAGSEMGRFEDVMAETAEDS